MSIQVHLLTSFCFLKGNTYVWQQNSGYLCTEIWIPECLLDREVSFHQRRENLLDWNQQARGF